MPIRQLDSPQNSTIKATAKLRTSRGRQQSGRIIIDGEREIHRAAKCGVLIESLFVPMGNDLDVWTPYVKDIYEVSARAHEKLAYGNRLEPVAVAARPQTHLDSITSDTLPPKATFVVLEAVEKPGNIGAVLRSADGAGISAVLLVDPLTDLFNPNAIRASLGTVFSVPVATASFDQYKDWSKKNGITSLLAVCDDTTANYAAVEYSGRNAIVLGNEAQGLSGNWDGIESRQKIFLPMRGIADSLNVSTAATVLMYEAMKD